MQIKSYYDILSTLITKIKATTDISDFNKGSVIYSLLEAIAQNDFENLSSIASILQLSNIDLLNGPDLDKKAVEYGLKRYPATKATSVITIYDPDVEEISSSLYLGKPSPIKGQSSIYITDGSKFQDQGYIFIGRDSVNAELVQYTQKINHNSFYELVLKSPLTNDHTINELVEYSKDVLDRNIPSGTIVSVQTVNGILEYKTIKETTLLAGKRYVRNIPIESIGVGTKYNVSANSINNFVTTPFLNAQIIQEYPITNASDVESDEEFRQRIKQSIEVGLTKGTVSSIINSVLSLSNDKEGIIKYATYSENDSTLFIDNGQGLSPSFKNISYYPIVKNATGSEKFLKLNQKSITRPMLISKQGPFYIRNGILRFILDESEIIDITFKDSDFVNPFVVTPQEVASYINNNKKIHARVYNNRLCISPADPEVSCIEYDVPNEDYIDFDFDSKKSYSLLLYKNNELLSPIELKASVVTLPIEDWQIEEDGNLIISVDNTPSQNVFITREDFSFLPYKFISIHDWARVLSQKISGVTVLVNDRTLSIQSNKSGKNSSIVILGGSYAQKMFNQTKSTGKSKDYILNRTSGTIKLLTSLSKGDTVSAGLYDARSYIKAIMQSNYQFIIDNYGDVPEIYVGKDVKIRKSLSPEIEVSIQKVDSKKTKISISTSDFSKCQVGDWIYIISSIGFINPSNSGIFQIITKGDSFVEILNPNSVNQIFKTRKKDEVVVFSCKGIPTKINLEGNKTLEDLIKLFKDNNIDAYKEEGYLKLLNKDGSDIGIPVSCGIASNFIPVSNSQKGGENQLAISKSKGLKQNSIFNNNILVHKNETTTPLETSFLSDSKYIGIFNDKWEKEIYRIGTFNYPVFNKEFALELEEYKYNPNDYLLIRVGPNIEHSIRIPISRLCKVKESIQSTSRSFSSYDLGGESNVDFSSLVFWDKQNIELKGFKAIFKAKNFYKSYNGATFIVRAKQFGINGSKIKFGISTPTIPNMQTRLLTVNTDKETLVNITLGSKEQKTLQIFDNTKISIEKINNAEYIITFNENMTDISFLEANDIITINSESGLPSNWIGSFPVLEKIQYNKVKVFNLNGSETFKGKIQTTKVTLPDDVLAQPTKSYIKCKQAIDGSAFYIYGEENALYVVYYNLGTPLINGIYGGEELEITDVLDTDSPQQVAQKTANNIINTWGDVFDVLVDNDTIIISPKTQKETLPAEDSPTQTQFVFSYEEYVPSNSVDGKYFTVATESGVICCYYKITTDPTFSFGDYMLIIPVLAGYTKLQLAQATRQAFINNSLIPIPVIDGDSLVFTASYPDTFIGTNAGTIYPIIQEELGQQPEYLTLVKASSIKAFSLSENKVSDIMNVVNESPYIEITPITDENIILSTKDEPVSVAHNHLYGEQYISLFDYENTIESFQNQNPHFYFTKDFELEQYQITKLSNIINLDGTRGEYFRLMPTTQFNLYQYLNHKTISSLPLFTTISYDTECISLIHKESGSDRFIETGGEANYIEYQLSSDVITKNNKSYFTINTPSQSLQIGDIITISTTDIIPKKEGEADLQKQGNYISLTVKEITTDIPDHATFSITEESENNYILSVDDCGDTITLSSKSNLPVEVYLPTGKVNNISQTVVTFDLKQIPSLGQNVIVKVGSYTFTFPLNSSSSKNESLKLLAKTMKIDLQFISLVNISEKQALLFTGINDCIIEFEDDSIPFEKRIAFVEFISKTQLRLHSSYDLSSLINKPFKFKTDFEKQIYLDIVPRLEIEFISDKTIKTKHPHRFFKGQSIFSDAGITSVSSVIDEYTIQTQDALINTSFISEKVPDLIQIRKVSNKIYALIFNTNKHLTTKYINAQDKLIINSENFITHGKFNILSVSDNCILFENSNNTPNEIINGIISKNEVLFAYNSVVVKGQIGDFKNLTKNHCFRKFNDDDSLSISIEKFIHEGREVSPSQASQIILSSPYLGESGLARFFAFNPQIEQFGREIASYNDIKIYKYWSVEVGDDIIVDSLNSTNKGKFKIEEVKLNTIKYKNTTGINESNIKYTINSDTQFYTQIKQIENVNFSPISKGILEIYTSPFKETDLVFKSKVTKISKTNIGFDSYSYGKDAFKVYQGLVATAQKVIDGDPENSLEYQGVKAVGTTIEVLPPIPKMIKIICNIDVIERKQEIYDNVKFTIINYINNQKMGTNISISGIIANVMKIYGVKSVKIVEPNSEYIILNECEKAYTNQDYVVIY